MEKSRILIVDDTVKNLQVLGLILREQGYEVEIAMNGQEALDLLEDYEIDLVLLDIMMPVMDGFETCRKIREQNKFDILPIIFLTAKTDIGSMLEGFEFGAQDYVTKPFDPSELLVRVKAQLKLKHSRETVLQLNNKLEEIVSERTAELTKTVRELDRLNADLKAFDKSKTKFLNNTLNDLKEPMQNLLESVELLKNQANSKEVISLINGIETSLSKLEDFESKATLLTKINDNDRTLNFEDINIIEPLEFALLKLENEILAKGLEVEPDIQKDNYMLKGNNNLLVQLFTNCLSLVIEAVPNNEKVRMEIAEVDNGLSLKLANTTLRGGSMEAAMGKSPEISTLILEKILKQHDAELSFEDHSIKVHFQR